MSRYQPPSSSRRRASDDLILPKSITPIRDLLYNTPNHGSATSIIGVVKDYRPPIPTRRSDYKCTLSLYDKSTESEAETIDLHVFRQPEEMPIVEAGDIVIVFLAKYQEFKNNRSLISSYCTDIHVYDSQIIRRSRGLQSAERALKEKCHEARRNPDAKEHEYVLWLYDNIDKISLPQAEEFKARAEQSLVTKDKFSLLKNVREGKFADLIVQVVREPFNHGDWVTLWVSDYTENPDFFNLTESSADLVDGQPCGDGDPFGYTSRFCSNADFPPSRTDRWIAPKGKQSMQITCWEPHASFVHRNIGRGSWVRLRNVQIRHGHNSVNIEGFLRQDRYAQDRLYVEELDPQADSDSIDDRLKDAIRRRRDHERALKQGVTGGGKRKAAEELVPKLNAKQRRKKDREQKQKSRQEAESKKEALLKMNESVVCDHSKQELVALSSMLEPARYEVIIDNKDVTLELPFTCAKYRTRARVVDFHPASLDDFAVRRQVTDYDCLSNDDGDGNSDDSSSSSPDREAGNNRSWVWEWRFALKLEEVAPTAAAAAKAKKPTTVWVHVGNPDAQLLTGQDAADLHSDANADLLAALREQMFRLWGNLEEIKVAAGRRATRDPQREPPPIDSDGEDDAAAADLAGAPHALSNRPFTCCIQQYGVKVRAAEGEDDDAGEGMRYQRVYGLFGTKIISHN